MKDPDIKIKLEKEYHELLKLTHYYGVFLLVLGFILNNPSSGGIYPATELRVFLASVFMGLAIISFYSSKISGKSYVSGGYLKINLIYISFLLSITAVIIFYTNDSSNYIWATLLLPVLFAASSMGKKAGVVMAVICSGIILANQILVRPGEPLLLLLESNLVFISILFVEGWFIGNVIELDRRYRNQLKENISVMEDEIARRKIVEEELRKLTRAVEQSPSIVIITDSNGKIEYANNKFNRVAGYTDGEVLKKTVFDIIVDDNGSFGKAWERVSKGFEWKGELRNKKKNNEVYWDHVILLPFKNSDDIITHVLKVSEDITERKQMELEMLRLERLHLVGEMAAAIGHEVRNPMTTVRGFLQLLGDKPEYYNYKNYFDLMIEELDRANSIITEFLSLAKNKPVSLVPRSIGEIVGILLPLINAEAIRCNKNLTVDIQETSQVLVDEKEIRQLLLNLVRNGLEAMDQKGGGNLSISVFEEGGATVLAVGDQGPGIEKEVLDKIGTPFFTTKNDGTGLGLATCYSIAERNMAMIKIETSEKGTTFIVTFEGKV
ncbi:MAG: ATP-binding protein [Bacillota bacterium]